MEASAAVYGINDTQASTDTMVHIVGKKSLNTELLADFMDAKLEFPCLCSTADSLKAALNQFPNRTQLAFFDSEGGEKASLLKLPNSMKALGHPRFYAVLYNVEPTLLVEMDALRRGIRGILYPHQPLDFFPRAARAVREGELWYSRNFLSRFIVENSPHPAPAGEACVILTRREREIVTKLAEGHSNQAIARHFHISPNTVKTHAYNIYKKIKVENRLQATLWLANSE